MLYALQDMVLMEHWDFAIPLEINAGVVPACKMVYVRQYIHIIRICSGITRGRVFDGELYAQRL